MVVLEKGMAMLRPGNPGGEDLALLSARRGLVSVVPLAWRFRVAK